jgi:predicted permease
MVSSALYAPMTGDEWNTGVRIEGKPEPGPRDNYSAGYTRITPGFFQLLGVNMVSGRAFTDDDNEHTRLVAVVNEAFAKRFFGNQNPIGQHLGLGDRKYAGMFEIVGVVANMRYMAGEDMKEPVPPMFYLPEAQTAHFQEAAYNAGEAWSHYLNNILLWAPGNPPDLQGQVKKALADVDPNFVMNGIDPYSGVVAADFAQQNMIASLTLLFGVIGLVLAAVGLYGVTAYGVEQRTSEIGVRMALGADRRNVIGMVLKGAFLQVGIGLAIGIPAAIGAGYLIASQLFGVAPRDPLLLLMATILLGAAALAAAILPALRAANLDPVVALRSE